jgi:membrane fusion protein, multidrug efflux system
MTPAAQRPTARGTLTMTVARTGWRLPFLLVLAGGLAACSGDRAESKQPPPRPVVSVAVAPVEQKAMPLQIQAIGTVEAYAVVSVRAQVGGELQRVHIKEGQQVRKGDLLFTIDPRTYEAALAQAEANVARDQVQVQQARAVLERDVARVAQTKAALARDVAQSKNAQVQVERYADLFKRELIAQEQYDQIRTNAEALAATVRADEADVRSAEETVRADQAAIRSAEQTVRADEAAVTNTKIQLGYTTIRSPVDGRAGSLMLNEGNIVRAGGTSDSTLLVINQVRPIYVSFTVPQQQLPSIRRYMLEGTLGVSAAPAGDPRAATGVVTFVDNLVDAATGTIRLKATFANEEGRLWPGQFANVTLTLASEPDAIVVPSAALQSGPQGAYVFVAKPDSTAENRRVTIARTQGNETVIAKGLQAGEKVVTDGQPRLTQGAKIEIRTAGGPGGGERPGGGGRPGTAGGERPAGSERPAGAERPAGGGPPSGAEQRPAADSAGAAKAPAAERPRTP